MFHRLLNNNQLRSIPETVCQLTNLQRLYILLASHLHLLTYPFPFHRYLYNNQLQSIPETIGQLTNLQWLSMFNNPLSTALPDLSRLTSLHSLKMSNTNQTTLPPLPLQSLTRIDINNNNLTGSISLCGPKLDTVNMNDNPLFTSVTTTGLCLPSLLSINAAKCNLGSLSFLRDSRNLTDMDISQNIGLGNEPFVLAKSGSWPVLQSLRADSIGVRMPIAEVLGSVVKIKSLLSLDVSRNLGIDGVMDVTSFRNAGFYNGVNIVPFNLLLLRVFGTQVSRFQTNMETFFPNIRVLSLGDTSLFDPDTPIDQQEWLHLEQVDIRGTSSLVKIADPQPFPGTPLAVDLVSNTSSLCPTTLIGGVVSKYSIAADPRTYNWSLCQCLGDHYGEPWKGCLVCPGAPRGETGVSVDCRTRPGVMNVTGGWIKFDGGAVKVVTCPSDSPRNPCAWGALNVTLRNVSEWEGARSRISQTCVEGYEGRLCARCKPEFFRSGRSCHRCGGKGLSWLNPLLSVVLLTALGVRSVAGGYKARSGLIRTLTMHAQLVALLPDMSLRLSDWSGFLVKSASSGSGGLRLNGLECEGKGWDGFYGPFVQAGLLPVIVVLGSAWIGLVSGYVGDGKVIPRLDRFKTAVFYLWLVLLFGSMQRLFAPLNCTDHGSTHGNRYLTSALWIACSGSSYRGLLATSVVLGLGYTFGTIGVVLYRLRPSTKGISSISSFLRSPYTQDCYYWEAVQLVRRVALAMASSLTKLFSPVQPVIVSSILILSLLAHTWRKPYARPIDNVVESISLTLLLSSYMAGLIASNPRFPPSATTLISWLFFALNALFLALLTATVLFRSAQAGLQRLKKASKDQHEEFHDIDQRRAMLLE